MDEWLDVKRRMLSPVGDGDAEQRTKKRNAMLIAAAGATATSNNHTEGNGDDLYNMDDLLMYMLIIRRTLGQSKPGVASYRLRYRMLEFYYDIGVLLWYCSSYS